MVLVMVFDGSSYSRARLIRMANAWKNHANCLSMRIIRAYFMLSNITLQRVVSRTIMRIIWGMRISEGQIIWAVLYFSMMMIMSDMPFCSVRNKASPSDNDWLKLLQTDWFENLSRQIYIETNRPSQNGCPVRKIMIQS